MTTRDVGDLVDLRHLVYDSSGTLTDATVVLTVTDPSGTTSTPTVTRTATGTYDAGFTLAAAGTWFWVWTVSGAVVDVDYGSLLAGNPAPLTYATLPELKAYLGITDESRDAMLQDALLTASRKVEKVCGRRFFPDTAASARVFQSRNAEIVFTDDFQSTTDLVVKIDSGDDGTFATTLDSSTYELEPFNNVVDGESGWPYYKIRSLNCAYPCWNRRRANVQVTARWGWVAVPDPVRQACIYLAEETWAMKGSPFGVANSDQFGPIRMRDNPKVMSMLAPYQDSVVLIA